MNIIIHDFSQLCFLHFIFFFLLSFNNFFKCACGLHQWKIVKLKLPSDKQKKSLSKNTLSCKYSSFMLYNKINCSLDLFCIFMYRLFSQTHMLFAYAILGAKIYIKIHVFIENRPPNNFRCHWTFIAHNQALAMYLFYIKQRNRKILDEKKNAFYWLKLEYIALRLSWFSHSY